MNTLIKRAAIATAAAGTMLIPATAASAAPVNLPISANNLVNVQVTDVLNNLTVTITVEDVDVAAEICAAVLTVDTAVDCEIDQ